MNFEQVRDYLYTLKTHSSTYGIERIQGFAEALGHPQNHYATIHVAGTNGKGSTCAMLESIYRQAGYRTGLYTSPHLTYLGERVQVNRIPIPPQTLAHHVTTLREHANRIAEEKPELHPSFFEFMTALAFKYFEDEHVDIAIIETGLGGRLDATNILHPQASVITSISLDHTEFLGDTLAEIAREKAGIIKPRTPVIMGELPPEAEKVTRQIAHEHEAPIFSIREAFQNPENYPTVSLEGKFQRLNAAIAKLTVKKLQENFPVSTFHIQQGLDEVVWEGRWQHITLNDGKHLILDATHNPEGAEHLEENLRALIASSGKPIILTGTTGEARAKALIPPLAQHAKELHLLRPSHQNATSYESLEAALPEDYQGEFHRSTLDALFPTPNTCSLGKAGDTILASGSIYLIGEIMERVVANAPRGGALLQD